MNYFNYYLDAIKKYVDFDWKATRKEYWMFILISFLISILISFIDYFIKTNWVLSIVYSLFIFLPSTSISIRRLHDIGKSGWCILINLVPFIWFIWFIILMLLPSKSDDNNIKLEEK